LLLDEATSALDSTSENAVSSPVPRECAQADDQVNRAIDSIIHEQHITVILAAHRLSSIARAERVVVIEDGKVSEEGRYDVLVSRHLSIIRSKLMISHVEKEVDSGH
jgi:ABC-type multidrug transport system fused ATPase/permease subunit